jgi:hypothetical protein
VKELRAEATALKEAVADLTLENRLLKNVWPAPLASRLLLAGLGRAQTYPA